MGRQKGKRTFSYQITLVPDGEEGYTVLVPLLPGCISWGKTIEHATKNAREAIALHLENLAAHRHAIPVGQEKAPVFTTTVHVTA